jgi:hypothetical protein
MQDMEKSKRRINFKIDDNVRKLTITGKDKDDQVVMREELSDDELDLVNGGVSSNEKCNFLNCDKKDLQGYGMEDQSEDFFNAGFMGMCSGYEQQGNLMQHNNEERNDEMDEIREDCFAYGSMGMCSGYEQQSNLMQHNNEEENDEMGGVREDCFAYSSMGMCSGYEQQASLAQDQKFETKDTNEQANPVEDCITHGFMGMCSGYELAGS